MELVIIYLLSMIYFNQDSKKSNNKEDGIFKQLSLSNKVYTLIIILLFAMALFYLIKLFAFDLEILRHINEMYFHNDYKAMFYICNIIFALALALGVLMILSLGFLYCYAMIKNRLMVKREGGEML